MGDLDPGFPMNRSESLRDEFARRYAVGAYFTLEEAIAAMVPFVTALAQHHQSGVSLFVHPSSLRFRGGLCTLDLEAAADLPLLTSDRACLAPEERESPKGGPVASVFSCGAILYEMLTGEPVGPSMLRPSELAPEIPESFELLLGKALITDPTQRPSELRALAQALHQCAPIGPAPGAVDADELEESLNIDLEVSMSLLPAATNSARQSMIDIGIARAKMAAIEARALGASPQAQAAVRADAARSSDGPVKRPAAAGPKGATERLAELKVRLEGDPRPRYVVIKSGMDHGPFTAVELLHQIATRSFTATHDLIDTFSKDERPISEWSEFAPFAEQAQRSIDVQQERKQLVAAVSADRSRTRNKALAAATLAVIGLAGLAFLYFRFGKKFGVDAELKGSQAENVDFEGSLGKGKGKGAAKTGGARTYAGNKASGENNGTSDEAGHESESAGVVHPVVPDGLSCSGARARYVEDYSKEAPPDLTAGSYSAVLGRGDYLNACAAPPSMSVSICAAVQNGHAVGVTVTTNPPNGTVARCVAGQVRSLSFPSHPRLDITTTSFAAN